MEVQCPICKSRFNLPNIDLRPQVKLRCSICSHIFQLEKNDINPSDNGIVDVDENAKSTGDSKSKLFFKILVVLLVIIAGIGVWRYMYTQRAILENKVIKEDTDIKFITIRDVRQYYVKNEKVGDIFVIEGKVVNEFPVPKELIEIEATIYDSDKAILIAKKQLAGRVLSLFQLQVLSEEELESFINNEIEILTKNTNIPTHGEVPFMILFYNPPTDVAEFGIKVISAKDIKSKD